MYGTLIPPLSGRDRALLALNVTELEPTYRAKRDRRRETIQGIWLLVLFAIVRAVLTVLSSL